jgi:putative ABC transport system substrate-binding protein
VNRREFITFLGGAAAWPLSARAQQTERVRRIGVLLLVSAGDAEFQHRVAVLRQALGHLGWTEQNTMLEFRFAEGKLDRLPGLARELVQANVDVIVTQGTDSTLAVRNATTTIPMVMASIGDAVGIGIVPSLARPGGNITGLTLVATEQSTKRLELIKELSPALARVAVVWSGDNASHRLQLKEMETATPVLGLRLDSVPVRDVGELDAGLQIALQTGAQAIVTMDDQLINFLRARIVELALRHKLPVMSQLRAELHARGFGRRGSLGSIGGDRRLAFLGR